MTTSSSTPSGTLSSTYTSIIPWDLLVMNKGSNSAFATCYGVTVGLKSYTVSSNGVSSSNRLAVGSSRTHTVTLEAIDAFNTDKYFHWWIIYQVDGITYSSYVA